MTIALRHASRTDRGLVREGNEDSLFAGERVFAVADGMGGHAAGEVASGEVISELRQLDLADYASRPSEALVDAMEVANGRLRERVAEEASLEGMGTTLSAMMLSGDRLALLHVGDSRAYRFVDGALTQLTTDDTLVQQLVSEGRITAEEAKVHPQRSLLTQALDGRTVEPHVAIFPAVPGERYLLCTDGLSGVVPEDLIVAALSLPDAEAAVAALVEATLERGAPDNVSVIVADVVDVPEEAGPVSEARGTTAAEAVTSGVAVGLATTAAQGGGPAAPAASAGTQSATGAPPHAPTGTADLMVIMDTPESAPLADIGAPGAAVADETTALAPIGEDLDEESGDAGEAATRRGRRFPRWVAYVVSLVLILVVGLVMFWMWLGNQWYVGSAPGDGGDVVAIYNGVPVSLASIDLSTVEQETDILVADLNTVYRTQVTDTIPASSLSEAQKIVTDIEANGLLPECKDVPDASTVPEPGVNCRPTSAGTSDADEEVTP